MPLFYHLDRRGMLRDGMSLAMPITREAYPTLVIPDEGISYFGHAMWTVGAANPDDPEFFRESVLESARIQRFPDRPSRYSAFFATDNLADALMFRATWGSAENPIWTLECSHSFRGDMNWFNESDLFRAAMLYWQEAASSNPFWEHLLVPPITVIGREESVGPQTPGDNSADQRQHCRRLIGSANPAHAATIRANSWVE